MTTREIGLTTRQEDGCTVVRPAGRLDLSTYASFRDSLLKYAAEEPRAVIAELGDEFEIASPTLATVFSVVWMRVSEWPGVPVMVVSECDRHSAALTSSGVARFVPLHGTVRAALDAVGQPVERRRHEVTLPAAAVSSRLAREFVRGTCRRWGVEAVVDDAALIASELTENVVQHTSSAPVLRVELRGDRFTVAVRDDDPRSPQARELTTDRVGGRGIPIVEAISRAWGCSPAAHGGKVIWAVLALPSSRRWMFNRTEPHE
jgi:anti-sigma regulatory factor (Ser/Thr protein kinase)